MVEVIKGFFRKNLIWKIFSLAIAFIIWFIVVNVSNPEVSDSVNLEIEVRNEDVLESLNKIYSLDKNAVKISYQVRNSDRSKVSSQDFTAYVDLNDYSVTGALPVYVEPSDRIRPIVSGISQAPIVAHIKTEDVMKKDFAVNLLIEGNIPEGYAVGEGYTDPGTVKLTGPVSSIGQISSIGVICNISDAVSDISGVGSLVYYDANNNIVDLPDINAQFTGIGYHLPVYKTKNLSITAQTSGEPAIGYRLNGIAIDTDFITVYGPDDILDSHKSIVLPAKLLNINGAGSNVTISADLADYIPEGLFAYSNKTTVTVVAQISKITGQSSAQTIIQNIIPQETKAPEETKESAEKKTEESDENKEDEKEKHEVKESSEEKQVKETPEVKPTEEKQNEEDPANSSAGEEKTAGNDQNKTAEGEGTSDSTLPPETSSSVNTEKTDEQESKTEIIDNPEN